MYKFCRDNIFELFLTLWVFSYLANGFGLTKFELASIWQGCTILIGFLGKHWIDSKYNSPNGESPIDGIKKEA